MSSDETSWDRQKFTNAAYYGRLEEVIALSAKFSTDVNELSGALIGSCVKGHLDVIKWLTKNTAADVNYKVELWTPLTTSSDHNHLDVVKYLVKECKADVNLPDGKGETSLVRACRYVRKPIVMYFLCEVDNLDVNIAGKYGNTALHYAVWCSKDYNTQLHKACGGNYGLDGDDENEVIRLITNNDYSINVLNNGGDTPLHIACSNGYFSIVKSLMLLGADETIINDRGETPAQVADRKGFDELLVLLDKVSLMSQINN